MYIWKTTNVCLTQKGEKCSEIANVHFPKITDTASLPGSVYATDKSHGWALMLLNIRQKKNKWWQESYYVHDKSPIRNSNWKARKVFDGIAAFRNLPK